MKKSIILSILLLFSQGCSPVLGDNCSEHKYNYLVECCSYDAGGKCTMVGINHSWIIQECPKETLDFAMKTYPGASINNISCYEMLSKDEN